MQTKIISEIIKISPVNKEMIKNLFSNSDIFHSLCIDLYECQTMIKKLEQENPIKKEFLDEYIELLYELKKELNSIILEQSKHFNFKNQNKIKEEL